MEACTVLQLFTIFRRSNYPPLYQAERRHATQTASWLPPSESWDVKSTGLPYGWEIAIDKDGKQYFINHLNKTTTYEDPRKEVVEEPPKPREVELYRDSDMGFGFVAGSEKPVIVRFVTEGGPSTGKLLPGDQILKVNGEDVKKAPRDHVIELVRACKHSVCLTVCQPHTENSSRKSALLSAAKKAQLKCNPSRVRFAEGVVINGSPLFSPSNYSTESCIPFMPNVLKVFLENGQTKSFKYDSSTLVQDVLESLQQKLSIKCIEHFSLVVEHIKSLRRNKLTLLDPKECLAKIAARPSAQHLRCLFRVTFVPKESYDLLKKDPVTFEYLYMQCCNDVVQERFAPELKYDIALRLAALHMQQHAQSSSTTPGKLSVKTIERECGLERFVPVSLMETMKRKELRKLLGHFLKLNQGLSAPGQKSLTALQAKLHYLRIISELPSYGAKCFTTNLRDSNMETVILVSPKFGISQISGIRNTVPITLADIEELSSVIVNREDELSHQVELQMKDPDTENILLSLEDRDSEELVLLLQGYYRLLTNRPLPVQQEKDRWTEDSAPAYHTRHTVQEAGWNYVEGDAINISEPESDNDAAPKEHSLDLASSPPPYQANKSLTANGRIATGTMGPPRNDTDVLSHSRLPVPLTENSPVDRNMNSTVCVPSNVPVSTTAEKEEEKPSEEWSTMVAVSSQFRHVVEMEFQDLTVDDLSKGKNASDAIPVATVTKLPSTDSSTSANTRNEEAVRRVAEMQQIVFDAESYLTEEETTDAEHDSSRGESTQGDFESVPKLKAADSLLLLTQVGRDCDLDETVKSIHVGETEPSESDTDSMSTPTDSPSHRPEQRRLSRNHHQPVLKSGSSFGLHSPDSLPVDGKLERTNLQELLQKLQDSQLPYPFAEGTLYLDPDIIDLTMIPPPITPDQEEAPTPVSFPPTPFADRQSLEAELVHGLVSINPPFIYKGQGFKFGPNSSQPERIAHRRMPPAAESGAEWVPHEDIDSFIASVTVPPPPTETALGAFAFKEHSPVQELTQEEISAFIIPPPPASSSSDSETEMIHRLHVVAAIVEEMVQSGDEERPKTSVSTSVHSTVRGGNGLQKVEANGDDQRDCSLPEVEPPLSEKPDSNVNCDSVGLLQPGDSSGYETYASSAISSMDAKRNRRLLNNSFSDNSSTVSCSSSEMAGSQADTEDNALDGDTFTHSPVLGAARSLPGSYGLRSNGVAPSRPSLANGAVRTGTGVVGNHWIAGVGATSHARCSSSSSDDGHPDAKAAHASGSPRRQSSIPRHHHNHHHGNSNSLTRKNLRATASGGRSQRSRSSSTDSLPRAAGDGQADGDASSRNGDDGLAPLPLTDCSARDWSASSENLATAAATAAADRRTNSSSGASPKSPTSPGSKSPRKKPPSKHSTFHTGDSNDTGTILKSPATSRSHVGSNNNNVQKPPLLTNSTMQEGKLRSTAQTNDASVVTNLPKLRRKPETNGSSSDSSQNKQLLSNGNGSECASVKTTTLSKFGGVRAQDQASSPVSPKRQTQAPSRLPRSKTGVDNKIECLDEGGTLLRLPLPTSSPKPDASQRSGHSPNNNSCHLIEGSDGSLQNTYCSTVTEREIGSEDTSNVFLCHRDRRDSFYGAEEAIGNMLIRLDDVLSHCAKPGGQGHLNDPGNRDKVMAFKEALISASKQFVTASKLFVKGATESEERLVECLVQCLGLMDQMFVTTERLAIHSSSPLQMQNLILKVKDVAFTFLQTLQAASDAVSKDMNDPSINVLMQQATTLAAVLTALMRTLRVFNP